MWRGALRQRTDQTLLLWTKRALGNGKHASPTFVYTNISRSNDFRKHFCNAIALEPCNASINNIWLIRTSEGAIATRSTTMSIKMFRQTMISTCMAERCWCTKMMPSECIRIVRFTDQRLSAIVFVWRRLTVQIDLLVVWERVWTKPVPDDIRRELHYLHDLEAFHRWFCFYLSSKSLLLFVFFLLFRLLEVFWGSTVLMRLVFLGKAQVF